MNGANFAFLKYMYMKRHFLKLGYCFCIVLVCSEPQEVFKYMEYLKALFYNHILKCYSNKINETRCNSLLPISSNPKNI